MIKTYSNKDLEGLLTTIHMANKKLPHQIKIEFKSEDLFMSLKCIELLLTELCKRILIIEEFLRKDSSPGET